MTRASASCAAMICGSRDIGAYRRARRVDRGGRMPSRQDQLHSYQFMIQRVVSALVMRETDPPRSPFRRLAGAALIGALLAALGFGGAAAYAVISPGTSTAWRDESAVIVEKETGALYVYREQRLQPVLNF